MEYRAVIENNNDPKKLGRVKVRIFNLHTANNENSDVFNSISTDNLPWAEVELSSGLVSGVGVTSILKNGTWVWVKLDNNNPNKPIVTSIIQGYQTNKEDYNNGHGFTDPSGQFPYDSRLNEPDTNRLSRNENLNDQYYDQPRSIYNSTDTIHKIINDNIDAVNEIDGISGANVSQVEPTSTDNLVEYPLCYVNETESGHVISIDDTPNNERMRYYHTSGSYIEIKPDGTFVHKCVNTNGESHYIHMSNVNEHVAKGVKRYIEENIDEIIGQSVKRHIKQNLEEHISGDLNLTVDGNLNWTIGGNININSQGTYTNTNGGNHSVIAPRIDLN